MKTLNTCEVCLTINNEDFEYEVSYHYYPPMRGSRGRYGEPLEPDDDAEIEVLNVIDMETKQEVTDQKFFDKYNEIIEQKIWEEVEVKIQSDEADYADYCLEQSKDRRLGF